MNSKRFSIRASLIWLVAVCLLPVIVLAAAFAYLDFRNERTRLVRETLSTARALMSVVDAQFAAAEISMYALSSSAALKNGDMPAFHEQAKEVLRRHNANNIVLIDASGQQIMNTAVPLGKPLPKAINTAQLRQILSTGKAQVSNLFIGPVLREPVINVAIPVYQGDTVVQSLVAVLRPDQIQKIVLSQRFPSDRIVAIFDGSSNIVAFTGDISKFRGKRVNPGLAAALIKADEGSLETVNSLGVEVLSTFTRSPSSRWGVAIGIPREAMLAAFSQTLSLLLGVGAMLLLGSCVLAYLIGGRITRAIRDLLAPARELGYGNPVVVPELRIGEADEVGRAITRASVMLSSARQSMSKSEAQMRGIVESATDAVVIVDDRGDIVLFNAASARMFGCPREAAVGSNFSRFIPERLQADFAAQLKRRSNLQLAPVELTATQIITVRNSNDEEFKAELSFPHVSEGANNVNTLIFRDIADRLRILDALERSNLDLQQFAFVASHDLKTPLRSIAGFLQLLKRNHVEKLDDKAVILVQRTLDATLRLEQLTDDLLSFARVNSEARPFALFNCTEAARDAIGLLDSAISDTQALVTVDPLPEVMGDRTQLIQLFLNLVGNGIKYCRGRTPKVHISVAKFNEREWLFSVADNGIGIETRHHLKIFEIFKRLHSQSDYAGTGIGLALCHRIVERHHGKIWLDSTPGEGSTFRFTLPIASESVP